MDQGIEQRFARQTTLVPPEEIAREAVTIIGVGAIGRQLAIQLTAMGVRRLQLIDFDQVAWPNVAAQGFATSDVGRAKVHAVAGTLFGYDPTLEVETVESRWRPMNRTHDVCFCCVDSISARSAIWRGCGAQTRLWGDARMLGEVIRILCATDKSSRTHYRTTLFEPSQAQRGSCTARSTIYAASIAAGLLCRQFAAWLRGSLQSRDLLLDLAEGQWVNLCASSTS